MRETSNYKLSQWDKTDRIQMEDFNADNSKVDAALAAEKQARENADAAQAETLRSENLWVKIGETTLSAAAETVYVTVPDPEKYRQIQMIFTTGGCSYLHITVNGSMVAKVLDFSSTCSGVIGFATLTTGFQTGYYIDCCAGARNGSASYGRTGFALSPTYSVSGSIILGLSANGGSLNAGTHIDIYGLKK